MTGSVIMMPPGADIFVSGAEVLVSPVDATGAQGKGLAKEFARRWPKECAEYRRIAQRGSLRAGNVLVGQRLPHFWLFFAATKQHWRQPSDIGDVATCALNIRREAIAVGALSVSVPALGCGQGGLDWDDVREILDVEAAAMSRAGIKVMIFAPHDGKDGGR